MTTNRGFQDRELPDSNGEGRPATFIDPDAPYTGPGRESLRVMAHNALSRKDRRSQGNCWANWKSYLDEMADAVASQAESFMGEGYESRRAWSLAIRLVVHGKEPD